MQASHGRQDGVDQSEAQAFGEARAPGGAVVGKIWLRHTPEWGETRFEGLVGRRWRVDAPAAAAAVQGGVIARGAFDDGVEWGGEARLMAGWDLGGGGFAGAEAGLQVFSTGLEPRLEATVGRSWGRSLAYGQLRYDQDHEGRGYARAEANFVAFSAGRFGVQLGARLGLDHDEQAVVIGLWRTRAPR